MYLHHGLLMNSEVWVCLTDEQRCLPFELVERGFDVWVRMSLIIPYLFVLTTLSLGITEATSTRKSRFTTRRRQPSFGTSPWTNLLSTTFQTRYHTF